MRQINKQRHLVETKGHRHAVKRGRRGRLHFENMPWLHKIFAFLLKVTHATSIGRRNALDIGLSEVTIPLKDLPGGFDGARVLLLSDLHIDALDGLLEKTMDIVKSQDYDYCILAGDYSLTYEPVCELVCERMVELAGFLTSRGPVYGILGNHDHYHIAEVLEGCGVCMLMNDNARLERKGECVYLAGVDDYHYYGAEDFDLAGKDIPADACKIVICHTPEGYREAADAGFSFYIAGHTHGGQVCLPGGGMIVTNTTAPRKLLKGKWGFGKMRGFTSRGVGVSGIRVRFFCRAEVVILTLTAVG